MNLKNYRKLKEIEGYSIEINEKFSLTLLTKSVSVLTYASIINSTDTTIIN